MRESNSKPKSSSKNKFFNLLLLSKSNPNNFDDGEESPRTVTSSNSNSGASSPFIKSPWITSAATAAVTPLSDEPSTALLCSLTREQGHLYSLAAAGDLLYTGSDSKNIRVWKPCRNVSEFSAFKSTSGLVKAIVISTSTNKIFTGHQDGKIRIWRASSKDPSAHKRVGTLPKLKDYLKSSINPSNYVEVRRHRSSVWLRHFDAVSCLSLDEDAGILYSGSWDKTIKVWRLSDSKCLESITAHDDAINSIVVGLDGLVFSGSADGTVKAWRRDGGGHVLVRILMRQESAVTAVAVSSPSSCQSSWVVYCGSSDGVVRWWRRGIGEEGGALRGHKTAVLCLAAAGRLVMSGGADGRVCVWRRGSGAHEMVTELVGHVGPVKCLAMEREGGAQGWRVYSGSLDKSVKVWRVTAAAEEEEEGVV